MWKFVYDIRRVGMEYRSIVDYLGVSKGNVNGELAYEKIHWTITI